MPVLAVAGTFGPAGKKIIRVTGFAAIPVRLNGL